MPEISENSHKISAAQLFCILLLMRVSSELAYPSKGGFGGSGLAAALTAEAVRFLIALPVLIYACKGGGFYAAVWRKNRFLGWVAAVGAALLLAGFVVRTAVYASGFVRRNMLLKTPQLLIALLMAAFAVYAAVKGGEALARAGVLFLWAAGIVTVLLILADIPYMDFGRELPEWSTELFLTDVVERFCRSGEYLVFAALLPYVRSSNSADRKKLGAAGFCFAAAGAGNQVGGGLAAGHADQRGGRSVLFKAAALAAGAGQTVAVGDDMPQFRGQPGGAAPALPIDDNAPANAGTQGEQNTCLYILQCTGTHFGQHCRVAIVNDHRG